MVSITIGTTTERRTVIAEGTLRATLSKEGFLTSGMTFHLNGAPLSDAQLDASVDSVATDGAVLIAVPAQKAGC